MIFNKKLHQAKQEITSKNLIVGSEGDAIINVKVTNSEEIFSPYDFDGYDKINPSLGEYIWDKSKFVPLNKNIKIKIYTDKDANEDEIKSAFKNNYRSEYSHVKEQENKNLLFSFIMFLLGVLFMSFLFVMHKFFYYQFLEVILEIATWVFFWESVDSFFLERAEIRRKKHQLLKLFVAEIEIIRLKNINKID